MHNPGPTHWSAVRRMQYLRGTLDRCLCYSASSTPGPFVPVVYTDSDFANDNASRLSVSGGVAFLCGAPVLWLCRTQRMVTLSTAGAETVALTDMMKEVIWLRRLLRDLGYPQESPTQVRVDNTAAIAIANSESSSRRTKHFDIRHKFNRQCIQRGVANVSHVPTDEKTFSPSLSLLSGLPLCGTLYSRHLPSWRPAPSDTCGYCCCCPFD
jgi:hypothetical protein